MANAAMPMAPYDDCDLCSGGGRIEALFSHRQELAFNEPELRDLCAVRVEINLPRDSATRLATSSISRTSSYSARFEKENGSAFSYRGFLAKSMPLIKPIWEIRAQPKQRDKAEPRLGSGKNRGDADQRKWNNEPRDHGRAARASNPTVGGSSPPGRTTPPAAYAQ